MIDRFGNIYNISVVTEQVTTPKKDNMVQVKRPKSNNLYFGSPTNHMPKIKIDRPLFVTQYIGIASIFIYRVSLRNIIPRGSYNLNYKEWIDFDKSSMDKPLKEVHVYVEGYPDLIPFSVEQEGYIHCIETENYDGMFYRYDWMTPDREYLISTPDNIVEFSNVHKVKVKYYIEGKPCPKHRQLGPSKNGIVQFMKDICNRIHDKCESDKKEPTGNQNCLLCSWCAESCIRGYHILPRPIYSPRDNALQIQPEDFVHGEKRIMLNHGYSDLINHLKNTKETFARWYCHISWNEGKGGHEFLIIKFENDCYIMDAQQGTFVLLSNKDCYMEDVKWDDSYLYRVDNEHFNYKYLESINESSQIVEWDSTKDVPYMINNGMLSKSDINENINIYL